MTNIGAMYFSRELARRGVIPIFAWRMGEKLSQLTQPGDGLEVLRRSSIQKALGEVSANALVKFEKNFVLFPDGSRIH